MKQINVTSEYGKLKKVLLHRPGEETESLTPETFEELLFDDSYYLKNAKLEHAAFVKVLEDHGVEVVFIENLVAETLDIDKKIKDDFIDNFVYEAGVERDSSLYPILIKYINSIGTTFEMVVKMIAGIRYSELGGNGTLVEITTSQIYVTKPMPNIIFQRDPFASIVHGISLHSMTFETRRRETLFAEVVFDNHPDYNEVKRYYTRNRQSTLEGGDVMMLNSKTLAVGMSQRTETQSLEFLAKNIFADEDNSIETIYAINIPKGRSWMHLDTIFTQIDINKFAIYSDSKFDVYKLTNSNGIIKSEKEERNIEELMTEIFGVQAILIKCGNGDPIHAGREQWNDGSNVLAIAPNTIIAYERNYVTNKALRDAGVNVLEIPSGELSRGRGGPRCMSMPLFREEV